MDLSDQDRDLAARTILSEAGVDGDPGMAAAAWVIKNRAESGDFGKSVSDVVLQPKAFTAWSLPRNDPNSPSRWSTKNPDYQRAASIVDSVWAGKGQDDPTGGSQYYLNPALVQAQRGKLPDWAQGQPNAVIGRHAFYGGQPSDDSILQTYTKGNFTAAPASPQSAPDLISDNDILGRYTKPPEAPQQPSDTGGLLNQIHSGLSGFVEGLPVIGPTADSLASKAAAGMRSLVRGTPYQDELSATQAAEKRDVAAYPMTNTVGQVAGAVEPMLAAGVAAPEAMGLSGPLLQRIAAGGASGALVNAADTAARGGDKNQIATNTALGAGFGAGFPVVGAGLGAAGRALFGSSDATTGALSQRSAQLGVPIRFAQASDSPFVQKLSQMAGKLPGSGMAALHNEQADAFTRAVSRTFGEDATSLTPEVMASAKSRIGSEFDAVAKNTDIKADGPFQDSLIGIARDAEQNLTPQELTPLRKQLLNVQSKIADDGTITGEQYQALTKRNSPLDQAIHNKNSNISFYASNIKSALDDALGRSATPEWAQRLLTARSQYKAMKTVEDLAEKSPSGSISGPGLMSAVRNSYSNVAYGGGNDLADLGRIGQRFMRQPADSGTPLGEAALRTLLSPAAVLAGGAGLGGAAGYALGGGLNWRDTLLGAAALPATALMARGATSLLNRPQTIGALTSRLPAVLPALNQSRLPAPEGP